MNFIWKWLSSGYYRCFKLIHLGIPWPFPYIQAMQNPQTMFIVLYIWKVRLEVGSFQLMEKVGLDWIEKSDWITNLHFLNFRSKKISILWFLWLSNLRVVQISWGAFAVLESGFGGDISLESFFNNIEPGSFCSELLSFVYWCLGL